MTEFCYNNATHMMMLVSSFYTMYRFNPEIFSDTESSNLRKKVSAAKKRVLKIQFKRKLLKT